MLLGTRSYYVDAIATRNKKLLGAPGLTTRNKGIATRGSWHRYQEQGRFLRLTSHSGQHDAGPTDRPWEAEQLTTGNEGAEKRVDPPGGEPEVGREVEKQKQTPCLRAAPEEFVDWRLLVIGLVYRKPKLLRSSIC